ncbi:ABC transporter permease, partial [Candidatus Sumerlaeota bacterium]|nr:ABC transporter permease [Candidatus Sumerlaeota bacterium]
MLGYLGSRLVQCVATLWVIATATFFLSKLIPGGPYDPAKPPPAEVRAQINAYYLLDRPLIVQYLHCMGRLARLDLGPSYRFEDKRVQHLIAGHFAPSAAVGLLALAISLGLGVPLGVFAAMRQNRLGDAATLALAMVGVSAPNFVLGTLLLYVFVYKLGWGDVGFVGPIRLSDLLLPAFTLAGFSLAFVTRITRASMIEAMRNDFVRTALAKGLSKWRVIWLHCLRNAVLPVLTYLGPLAAALLTGSFVVEHIFNIPGLGAFFVRSLEDDPPAIVGAALFYSALLVVFNLVIDLLYGLVDPQIAVGARGEK